MTAFARDYPAGFLNPRHSHSWDQLLYASAGVMSVVTDQGNWVIPPQRACWVPAGVLHSFRTTGVVKLRSLYLPAALAKGLPRHGSVVEVSPLLRELILHCIRVAQAGAVRDAALIEVILGQLRDLPPVPLQQPWPGDARALRVARRLADDPEEPRRLEEICREAGASKRTIERLFVAETGLTLGRWRAQQRVAEALNRLAGGQPVNRVAWDLGYSSPSAFISRFKQTMGETPKRYFRRIKARQSGDPPEDVGPPIFSVPTVIE